MNVQLVSFEEGRWDLVHVAKEFCRAVEQKKCKSSDLTLDLISNNLCCKFFFSFLPHNLPPVRETMDPDLILLFGSVNMLNGFPPWQVRLTELLYDFM